VTDALNRMVQRTRNLQRALLVVLQQVKCHARSRFRAHARQLAQGLGQAVKGIGCCHFRERGCQKRNALISCVPSDGALRAFIGW